MRHQSIKFLLVEKMFLENVPKIYIPILFLPIPTCKLLTVNNSYKELIQLSSSFWFICVQFWCFCNFSSLKNQWIVCTINGSCKHRDLFVHCYSPANRWWCEILHQSEDRRHPISTGNKSLVRKASWYAFPYLTKLQLLTYKATIVFLSNVLKLLECQY